MQDLCSHVNTSVNKNLFHSLYKYDNKYITFDISYISVYYIHCVDFYLTLEQ